jgi:hypothetical protein
MSATHLGGGRDVVLPQYLARVDERCHTCGSGTL